MGESELDILFWDNPKLFVVCDKIEDNEFGPELQVFGKQLITTMEARNGIGLAAPQVGILKRMFVMRFPDHEGLKPEIVCNPTFEFSVATLYEREGCLSLPSVFEQVTRSANVVMQYRDPLGVMKELPLSNFNARVAQHEADHLDGKMFFDRMSRQLHRDVLRRWKKEKKRRGL